MGRQMTSPELRESLPGIDGYIAGLDTIDRAALECTDQLKVSARYGGGWITSISQQPRMCHRVTNTPGKNNGLSRRGLRPDQLPLPDAYGGTMGKRRQSAKRTSPIQKSLPFAVPHASSANRSGVPIAGGVKPRN